MTENLNISGEQERKELDCAESERAERKETEYLKESLRLVELRLEEQRISKETRERKAGLLVAFCVAAIGYLYTDSIEMNENSGLYIVFVLGKLLTVGVLLKAAWHGIKVLDLKEWKVRGSDTSYLLHQYFSRNLNKMMEHLLGHYGDIFNHNISVMVPQITNLRKARNWTAPGIIIFAIWVAREEIISLLIFLFID